MDIQERLTELFTSKDVVSKNQDTNSEMDLKKIENQLNIHMKNKQGLNYKKVTIATDKFYDADKFSAVIDGEIQSKIINKKWKGLPLYMKWRLVETYLNNNNIIEMDEYKRKLQSNELDVVYEDNVIKKIVTLL